MQLACSARSKHQEFAQEYYRSTVLVRSTVLLLVDFLLGWAASRAKQGSRAWYFEEQQVVQYWYYPLVLGTGTGTGTGTELLL